MGYKLLGMAVWKGAKLYLRRRYGSTTATAKPVVAGGLLIALVGVLLIAKSRDSSQ